MDISNSYGFKYKYPILYNIFITKFAILFLILCLILVLYIFSLAYYLTKKAAKLIKDFIFRMNYNQPGSNQPGGQGGQPWGSPGGPNGQGPKGPNGLGLHQKKKSICGEEECYTSPNSLLKCLDRWSEKITNRIVEVERINK